MERAAPLLPPIVCRPPGLPPLDGLHLRELRYPPRLELGRHSHDGAVLCYALRGGFRESGPRGVLDATPGSLTYLPAAEPHANRVAESGLVGLRLELVARWLDVAPGLDRLGPRAAAGSAGWFAAALTREIRRREDASEAAIESLVILVLTALTRGATIAGAGMPGWVRRVRERLHDELTVKPSLAALAREAGVHPGHLARVFQRHFGCTVGHYVRELRLDRARELLRASREPLAEVAQRCGFADQSHLGRAFKRRFGVSPGAFRRHLASGPKGQPPA